MDGSKIHSDPPLDSLDEEILNLLQHDGRAPYSTVARELNTSEATVHARVQKMIDGGIIEGFRAMVNTEKMGFALSAFILIDLDPKRAEFVVSRLRDMNDVVELYEVTGECYFLAKIAVKTKAELTSLLDHIGVLNGVTSTHTLLILRQHKEGAALSTRH